MIQVTFHGLLVPFPFTTRFLHLPHSSKGYLFHCLFLISIFNVPFEHPLRHLASRKPRIERLPKATCSIVSLAMTFFSPCRAENPGMIGPQTLPVPISPLASLQLLPVPAFFFLVLPYRKSRNDRPSKATCSHFFPSMMATLEGLCSMLTTGYISISVGGNTPYTSGQML